jgi:hypothetical protein
MAVNDANHWGDRQEVLTLLGATLLLVQMAERTLKSCMTFAIQKEDGLTIERYERQTAEEAKKTLGYFLTQLRRRVDVHPKFDAELSDFLEFRNRLVHDLDAVNGLSFGTPEGRAVAQEFILATAAKANYVTSVFMGLIRAWAEDVGIEVEVGQKDAFAEIDAIYKPLVDEIFWEKAGRPDH